MISTFVAAVLLSSPTSRWSAAVDGPVDAQPAVANGRVFVSTMHGSLMALSLKDGHKLWRFTSPSAIASSPCVVGNRVYFGDDGGVFSCLDAATGKQLWHFETGDKIVSTATVVGERVVFGSYDTRVYCLRTKDGARVWQFGTDAQVHASPLVTGKLVLVAGCDGYLRSISLANGKQRWKAKIGGNVAAGPKVLGNLAFVGTSKGICSAVDLATGRVKWQLQEREEDAGCYGGIAAANHLVMFPSRSRRVFAVNDATGKLRWTFHTRFQANSGVTVVGSLAWFGSDEGTLYGVGLADGIARQRIRLGGKIAATPCVAGTQLLVGTSESRVFCVPIP